MKISLLLLSLGVFSALQLANAGDITGTITLKGTPPPEIDIGPTMTAQSPDCAAMYAGRKFPTTHFYVVGSDGGLGDVVITLKGGDFKSTGASAAPALLDQKDCVYDPQIFAVQTGQKIIVKNSDMCVHNVHAKPAADSGNPESNQLQMPGGADLPFTFDKPEAFLTFQCDVHHWMHSWVTVVDNPYYAVTDKDGKFTIKNVPPGKYTLVAMHRKLSAVYGADGETVTGYKGLEKEIDVTGTGATTQDFTFTMK